MSVSHLKYLFLFLFLPFLMSCESNREIKPQEVPLGNRKSPIAIASLKQDSTYLKIVYGQPYRNNRTIFGDWLPYGEVWRLGANEATEMIITQPIELASNPVAPGVYALFAIPSETSWTIILNKELGQWGAFEYNPDFDYIRFQVPISVLDTPIEALNLEFAEVDSLSTKLIISWDVIKVEIPIQL